jgi:hypothetical protein
MPVLPTTKRLCYAFGNRVYFIPAKGRNLDDFGFWCLLVLTKRFAIGFACTPWAIANE